MTETIAYDLPVKDLIAELNETSHVTHKKHKKTSVTLHGSDAYLSNADVLKDWEDRKISMQFGVDEQGNVSQYVVVNEYAWAVGSNEGNESSIHVEMSKADRGSTREISNTLKSTARLVGWLFVYAINDHPSKENIFLHDHWSEVSCLDGYLSETIFNLLLGEIQGWYVYFRNQQRGPTTFEVVDIEPEITKQIKQIQKALGISQSGVWNKDTDQAVLEFRRKYLRR